MPVVTPTLTFCDELVTVVSANWGSQPAGSAVARDYLFRQPQSTLAGVQAVFFPTDYEYYAENRKEDGIHHLVTGLVATRYTDATHAGLPPNSWLDPWVDLVYTNFVRLLWFKRSGPHEFSSPLRAVITLSVKVELYDAKKLSETPGMFWSTLNYDFLELVTGA